MIDTKFIMSADAGGRDPDSYSPTLRRYHRLLWSKPLPGGRRFDLFEEGSRAYLRHESALGVFDLASDGIAHSYSRTKRTAHLVAQVPSDEVAELYDTCCTVGGYTIFPGRRIEGRATVNIARGLNGKIGDRFDLTLECIRRHYIGDQSPLSGVLDRYRPFFELFQSFRGYVEFFLFQDLVNEEFDTIRFIIEQDDFERSPFPQDLSEYRMLMKRTRAFVEARNRRIEAYAGALATA